MLSSRLEVLRKLRNDEIIKLATKYGLSVKSLAYLFTLSESSIRQITGDQLLSSKDAKKVSIDELDFWRSNKEKNLLSHGYSQDEVDYMFHKGSLVKDEETTKLRKQIKQLEIEKSNMNKTLQYQIKQNESMSKGLENQKSKISSLESENKKFIDKISELDSDVSSLMDKMLKLNNAKKELQSELRTCKSQLDSYKENNETLSSSLDSKETELCLYKDNNKSLSSSLESKEQELQRLSASMETKETECNFLRRNLDARVKENEDLQNKLESLLSSQLKPPTDSKYKQVYDRNYIKSVYISCNYKLKATFETLRSTGVEISYRHLSTVLKEEKVYKRTYTKSKPKSRKK